MVESKYCEFVSKIICVRYTHISIQVEKSDNLPKFLCKECTTELLVAAKFREKCERTQQLLAFAPWKNTSVIGEGLPIKLVEVENEELSTKIEATCDSHLLNERKNIIEVHPDSFVKTNLNEEYTEEKSSANKQFESAIIPEGENVFNINLNGVDIIEETSEECQVMEYFESNTCEEEQEQENFSPNKKLTDDIECTGNTAIQIHVSIAQ